MADLERYDVYVEGTFDPTSEGRERAAVAAAAKLAAKPEQIRTLLGAGRVRVRTNLGPDLADQLVGVLMDAGVRAVRSPTGQKPPASVEFQVPRPGATGTHRALAVPPAAQEEPDLELIDGPGPAAPRAQPPQRPQSQPVRSPPTGTFRAMAGGAGGASSSAPARAAASPRSGQFASASAAKPARDLFAPPDEQQEQGRLELDDPKVTKMPTAVRVPTLSGVHQGMAAKARPLTIRERIHENPLLRMALGLVLALGLGFLPAQIYADSVDESRITSLLREGAEAKRDNRPIDAPRSEIVVARELSSARLRQEILFAILWLFIAAGTTVAWYRFI